MFRAEEDAQVDLGGFVQQPYGADAGAIDAGVVRDQPHRLSTQRCKTVALQDVDPGQNGRCLGDGRVGRIVGTAHIGRERNNDHERFSERW